MSEEHTPMPCFLPDCQKPSYVDWSRQVKTPSPSSSPSTHSPSYLSPDAHLKVPCAHKQEAVSAQATTKMLLTVMRDCMKPMYAQDASLYKKLNTVAHTLSQSVPLGAKLGTPNLQDKECWKMLLLALSCLLSLAGSTVCQVSDMILCKAPVPPCQGH